MIDIIQINILKLLNIFLISKKISKKINHFYVNKAIKTVKKLKLAKKNNLSSKQIKDILYDSGIRLDIKNEKFYIKLLDLITSQINLSENRDYIKNQLKINKFDYVGLRTWLRLRDLFYIKLELVLGGICRKKAVDYALKSKTNYLLTRKDKFRAKLDFATSAKEIGSYLKKNPIEHKFYHKDLNKFMSSLHNINFNIKNYEKSIEKNKFYEILDNKSVAIVGPAKTDQKNAQEIDAFDTVVRLNYTHVGKNLDEFYKGFKTDISYFSGEQVDYLIEKKNGQLPNDIKLACIKDNNMNRKKILEQFNPNKPIKRITNYNMFTFYSSLNILPLVLLDILEANVKRIKIFHSDMFLTKIRSPGYYPKEFNLGQKIDLKSFLDHDPMSQHEILKKLNSHKKITGDEKFDKVMKLDTYEYLKKLEETYREY